MDAFLKSLNNREIASLIWLAVMIASFFPKLKGSLLDVARAILNPKLLAIFCGLAANVVVVVALLLRWSLWDLTLLKDTIAWYLMVGTVSVFASARRSEDNLPKALFIKAISLTFVAEYLFSTYVLSLWWELILVPIVALPVMMLALAKSQPEHRVLVRPLEILLGAIYMLLVVNMVLQAVHNLQNLAPLKAAQQVLLAPVLSIATIPFMIGLGLYAGYEELFIRIGFWLRDRAWLVRWAKRRALAECRLSLERLGRLRGHFYVQLSEASNADEISHVVRLWSCGFGSQALIEDEGSINGEVEPDV